MASGTEIVQLVVGIIAIVSVLYQVVRVERIIYQAIDTVKDSSDRNYFELQKRIDLLLQDYTNKKLQDDRNFSALTHEINHECGRLRRHQIDIENYLAKDGHFRVRTYYTSQHEFGKDEDYQ